MPSVGESVWIERRKWIDDPHYGSEGVFLGEDEHGWWVGAQPGNHLYKGSGPLLPGRFPIVWCVPRAGWYLAHHLVGHPDVDVYIDIAAPAVWSARGAKLVDLDFDVIVWNDGRPVELVDEDEFEQHRVALGYPDDLVASARTAARQVLAAATERTAPFSSASAVPWFSVLDEVRPVVGPGPAAGSPRSPATP
jgi:protein associated with RNAse G/E